MKLIVGLLAFTAACWPLEAIAAFVPPCTTFAQNKCASPLYARYTRSLPPIPPPPPPKLDELSWVDTLMSEVTAKLDGLRAQTASWETIQGQIHDLERQLETADGNIMDQMDNFANMLVGRLTQYYPSTLSLFQNAQAILPQIPLPPTVTLALSAVASYVAIRSVLGFGAPPAPRRPYPTNRYDALAARAYFDQHGGMAVTRSIEIVLQSAQFALKLLQDKRSGINEATEVQRGKELADLLTRLGPTFIKVGQSLSLRTDLLAPAYIRGLETLQDQVPAFDTNVARHILQKSWGRPVEQVIDELPSEPIAAASLGQVYKARLTATGQQVAIKVQRPDILTQIALDMHLIREAAPIIKRAGGLNSDLVGTVDAWGAGFIDELDYVAEARNAEFFQEQISNTSLKDVVFAPLPINDYTTGSVLVTEWIDGERLDRSVKDDIPVICSIAMNTYLTMLLDIGVLHCDPHMGNLLRTPDGRLCILDWGMVSNIGSKLQLTLMEHMAHLTSADYAEVPRDLLLLDFIPESKADMIEDSGIVQVLADIYGKWTKGGGARSVNINDVINRLKQLQAEKGNIFQIPPYFAYIAKTFSVLEGIGLSNDPSYSIINGCLPYVSKRLLTDQQRMGPALSTFVFGPDKGNKDRIVSYRRVEQLIEGFGEYAQSSSGALLGNENASKTELLEDTAEDLLDIIFTEEETPAQAILLEQLAKIISASIRSIFTQIRERSGILPTGRTVLGTLIDPLGIWRTSPLVRMNDLDERTVETTRKLFTLMQKQLEVARNPMFDLRLLSRQEAVDLSRILVQKVWDRRAGVFVTSSRFARQLIELTADKLERGERDSRKLPAPPQSADRGADQMIERRLEPTASAAEPVSPRLQAARALLNDLQNESASYLDAVVAKTHL